ILPTTSLSLRVPTTSALNSPSLSCLTVAAGGVFAAGAGACPTSVAACNVRARGKSKKAKIKNGRITALCFLIFDLGLLVCCFINLLRRQREGKGDDAPLAAFIAGRKRGELPLLQGVQSQFIEVRVARGFCHAHIAADGSFGRYGKPNADRSD